MQITTNNKQLLTNCCTGSPCVLCGDRLHSNPGCSFLGPAQVPVVPAHWNTGEHGVIAESQLDSNTIDQPMIFIIFDMAVLS